MSLAYTKNYLSVNSHKIESDEFIPLSVYSQKDIKWNVKKNNANSLQTVFLKSEKREIQKYAKRVSDCANGLFFNLLADPDTGEVKLKLRGANFCHARHCPICDWRRSLRVQAMFKNQLPEIIKENPNARWIFLTLTVENCKIEDLRETITSMNKAFMRMLKRKAFSFVKGWIKKVEVTQEKNRKEYAHPHFHVLLMVNESYFKNKGYLTKMDWVNYWSKAMKSKTQLSVDVRALRKNFNENDIATVELLKAFNYSVKTSDILEDSTTQKWFLEYINQVHALKFLTSGLALKNIFKDHKEENENDDDLINVDDENDEGLLSSSEKDLYFFFQHTSKSYVKKRE